MHSTAAEPPHLSLVLACYNEERILAASFDRILTTLSTVDRSFEIIFVDDASRDRTCEVIASLADRYPQLDLHVVRHAVNQGRGAAVAHGFQIARGTIAGYLDVDLEVDCDYLPRLLSVIAAGADVATVRRRYAPALAGAGRSIMSRGYARLVRRWLDVPLHDTETGFKFFRLDRLRPTLASIESTGWFWDTEFMVRAWRSGLIIQEIPGEFRRRADKASTVHPIRDALSSLRQLRRFRRKHATP